MRRSVALLFILAGCAAAPAPAPAPSHDSVVPGTIGVLVGADLVVTAVNKDNPLHVGDRVVRYNGEPVSDPRQFYRLVIDSRPGSVARLEVLRDGAQRAVEVPVEQADTAPRT